MSERFVPIGKVLDEARSHLGYKEGPGENQTRFGEALGRNFEPWCQSFVSYVLDQVNAPNFTSTSGTQYSAQWFKDRGRLSRKPHVGDVVYFSWNGGREIANIDHAGFVEAIRLDGTIVSVEGNTSDQVLRRYRNPINAIFFGTWTDYPIIREGDTGKAVKKLQAHLGVVVDGKFGPLTSGALRAYQRTNNLAVDGVCGDQTWGHLLESGV